MVSMPSVPKSASPAAPHSRRRPVRLNPISLLLGGATVMCLAGATLSPAPATAEFATVHTMAALASSPDGGGDSFSDDTCTSGECGAKPLPAVGGSSSTGFAEPTARETEHGGPDITINSNNTNIEHATIEQPEEASPGLFGNIWNSLFGKSGSSSESSESSDRHGDDERLKELHEKELEELRHSDHGDHGELGDLSDEDLAELGPMPQQAGPVGGSDSGAQQAGGGGGDSLKELIEGVIEQLEKILEKL